MTQKGLSTRAVHAGEAHIDGALVTPVFQSSTFMTRANESYDDIRYIRLNNTPTHDALHAKLAALEQGEAALTTASGMAAMTTCLLALLPAGGHVIAQTGLYGGTSAWLAHEFSKLGHQVTFVDGADPSTWDAAVQPSTHIFVCETISNPLLKVVDVESVLGFCRKHKLISVIDNTFASPVFFNPLRAGFDVVMHSATKYLNGHTDIVAGVLVSTQERINAIRHALNLYGGALDPHACFLLSRGLKTLELRVQRQAGNAHALARFLHQHPGVARVYYPGLEEHPSHAFARQNLTGFGGMLAFELRRDTESTVRFARSLELAAYAPSLGGVETLITIPAITSHAGLSAAERHRIGIADGCVRVSVGIENEGDLIADFKRALET